ncbi:phage tail protein [Novosphingobium sp.]|uniref:GTA baseplate fiber-binding domain-containing protein n=1 Tax=Novosphingobium sp. TaxID=1874826 RepID=UPI0025F80365|nr:phage tail protein [Novosphingobium sp.]
MATLVLTAVGTALGGPLGGAIGALVGRQVDYAVIGSGSARGPRLQDLSVQTSSYGAPIPLQFGRMRTAGTVIWATDLVEHNQQSGGKAKPTVTTYAYTVSFAVVLASRPIVSVGRIWADGNLLRGAAGDLKVAGQIRIHDGHGDQAMDPLLAQAEGITRSPAYRNSAYAVFEDLALANFGNRIPSLTFEIFADSQPLTIGAIAAELAHASLVSGLDAQVAGYSLDRGSVGDTLDTLGQAYPIACAISGEDLLIGSADLQQAFSPVLAEPAAGGPGSDAVKATGWSRQRNSLPLTRQCGVRYYDVDRDYQPGLQQGIGRSALGNLAVIELPAALAANDARLLAEAAGRRLSRPSDTIHYRTNQIDPSIRPGSIVRLPIAEGLWRIDQWEWQADGVLLELSAQPRFALHAPVADSGRSNAQPDSLATPTILNALELPWDGSGTGDLPMVYAAASATSSGWSGAALFAEHPGGGLDPLGSTGRRRAVMGTTANALAPASPHFVDRANRLEIVLAGEGLAVGSADFLRLGQGANRALVGEELIQFGSVEWTAPDRVVLTDLLRGRGGSEWAVAGHAAGDPFVLVDDTLVPLNPLSIGDPRDVLIVASGLGDREPVASSVAAPGSTRRPFTPVHGKATRMADGSIVLSWVRRARGAFAWPDSVETPLNEQSEGYEVLVDNPASSPMRWMAGTTDLTISSEIAAILASNTPRAIFRVSQLGNAAASFPLAIQMPE